MSTIESPNEVGVAHAPHGVQLSVCVIGRNEGPHLARAAASLRQLDALGLRWESLFVDSASTDGSVLEARRVFDIVVALGADRRLNAGAARYVGTLHARGQWILYLDGDMELAPEIVPAIDALIQAGSAAAGLSGTTENYYPDGTHEPICYHGNVDGEDCRLFGGAVLLPRQLVLDAGNWSCGLFAYEESELYARLLRRGARVRWHEARLALHHTPRFDARRKLVGSLWPRGSHLGKKFFGAGQVTRLTMGEGHFVSFARLKWEPYLMLGSVLAGLAAWPWLGWRAVFVPVAGLAFNTVRLGLRGAANYACWLSQVPFGWFELDRSFRPLVVGAWAREGAPAPSPGKAGK